MDAGLRETLADRSVVQVLAGDPGIAPEQSALLAARGRRAVLRVPLVWQDRVVGALEAYSDHDRPWSRFAIRRARIIGQQLGASLQSLEHQPNEAWAASTR